MKKQVFHLFLMIVLIAAGIASCDKNDESDKKAESQLVVTPDTLKMNDDEQGKLILSVEPPRDVEWKVTSQPSWLEFSSFSGMIKSPSAELEITPRREGLDARTYEGSIQIITNKAGVAVIPVELYMEAHPKVALDPESLEFPAGMEQQRITIFNTGTGYLEWEWENQLTWLTFSRETGTVGPGYNTWVQAAVSREDLPLGTEQGQVILKTNSENGDVVMDVSMEVPPITSLVFMPDRLEFDYFENQKTLYIKNEGNTVIDWSIDNGNDYLSFNPTAGSLPVDDSIAINAEVDRSSLITKKYITKIYFQTGEDPIRLPIIVDHHKDNKWHIEGQIIDAEYDRNNDVVVAISENPYEIRSFDPIAEQIDSLALEQEPMCISVSQDGNYAAIGHDKVVSYINLNTMELIGEYSISAEANDIILAPNNWVYVFRQYGFNYQVICLDLSTGSETLSTGQSIDNDSKAKLHPSGDFIYVTDHQSGYSNLYKFDITNGTAEFLYESPDYGEYTFGSDLWISEDGLRLYTQSRNIFYSSTDPYIDMTYYGQFQVEGNMYVASLDHSNYAGKVFVLPTKGPNYDPENEFLIYEDVYFSYEGTKNLSDFIIPDGQGGGDLYEAKGHYGFFNRTGTRFFVLVEIEATWMDRWAIESFEVN